MYLNIYGRKKRKISETSRVAEPRNILCFISSSSHLLPQNCQLLFPSLSPERTVTSVSVLFFMGNIYFLFIFCIHTQIFL